MNGQMVVWSSHGVNLSAWNAWALHAPTKKRTPLKKTDRHLMNCHKLSPQLHRAMERVTESLETGLGFHGYRDHAQWANNGTEGNVPLSLHTADPSLSC